MAHASAQSSVCVDKHSHNVDTKARGDKGSTFKGKDGLSFMVTIWVMERL